MKVFSKNLNEEQLNTVKNLANEVDVTLTTASILFKRGYDTKEKIVRFLNPSSKNYGNPFDLSGMTEAVERIKQARLNAETVVVYGDYDVDGICASTILTRALKIYGIDAYTVIPERENGYGLSEGVINEVLETCFPDLIITVDCGISSVSEVEYLKDLGVDVIVTDHHEIPEQIPDCTVINCKLENQNYSFSGLCGAGVAYKLACALIGSDADLFIDLVALATVADNMPLIDENRDIVYEGLQAIKRGRCSRAIRHLLDISQVKEVTASSFAFAIAPRVNASGRMGNAKLSLELFLSDDEDEMKEICVQLTKYNVDRQVECEELLKDVKRSLLAVKPRKVIVAYGENWKNGLLGIVSAKITEEYSLPSIILTEKDGVLHGSARSIDGVNVFDVLSSAKDLLVDFGGHAQAAGVTVEKANLQAFIDRINNYAEETYADEIFERKIEVEEFVTEKFSLRQAREIALLEPFGIGNKKPLFAFESDTLNANKIKPDSTHVSISGCYIDLMYFGGVDSLEFLCSDATKTIVFEPNISSFNGRDYLKGYVKTVVSGSKAGNDVLLRSAVKAINALPFKNYENAEYISVDKINELLKETKPSGYGVMFVLSNPENAKNYPNLDKFAINILKLTEKAGKNCVVIGGIPENDDMSNYDTLVYLDAPLCVEKYVNFKKVIVCNDLQAFNLSEVSTDRSVLGKIFKSISSSIIYNGARTLLDMYKQIEGVSLIQFAFAISVFTELEFLTYNGVYSVNSSVKKELTTSTIYNKLINL